MAEETKKPQQGGRYCPNCGARIFIASPYCIKCGEKLQNTARSSSAQTASASAGTEQPRQPEPAPEKQPEKPRQPEPVPEKQPEKPRQPEPAPEKQPEQPRQPEPAPEKPRQPEPAPEKPRQPEPAPQKQPEQPRQSEPAPTKQPEKSRQSEPAHAKRTKPERQKKAETTSSGGVLSAFGSALWGIVLVVFSMLFMVIYFLHTLAEDTRFPALGDISAGSITVFMDSVYPILICGGLVLIPLILLILINFRQLRKVFPALGWCAVSVGVLCIPMGLFNPFLIRLFPEAMQNVLNPASAVFSDLCYVFAIGWIVLGAFMFSVYSCIRVFRGDKK